MNILAAVEEASKSHGSFAVWKEGGISDLAIIEESIHDLHGRVIFVGYNASGAITPFSNFHSVHQGGRDSWLADAIGNNPRLRGAYMTDFFKGDHAVRERGVDMRPEVIQRNLDIFKAELAIFQSDKPVLAAFGDKTFKLLHSLGFKAERLPHYARLGITRDEFSRAIKALGEKL